MAGLGKSCLRWLLLYVALAAAIAALAYARFPQPRVAVIAGCILGVPLWLSFGYIAGTITRSREARSLRNSQTGGQPEDGAKVAVSGIVRGTALESPITKRHCVLYEYKISPDGSDVAGVFEGFAMSGVIIEGPRGAIRLLAAPELAFDADTPYSKETLLNFEEYVARTNFTTRTAVDLRAELAHLKSVFADDDGQIRYDIRRAIPNAELSEMLYREKVLVAGDRVVAVGRYSGTRGGLVPDPTALVHPVKLMKGDPEVLARGITKRNRVDVPMAFGCLVPVIAAALLALATVPVTTIEQILPNKVASARELRLEQWLDQNVRPQLAQYGVTPWDTDKNVHLEPNSARGYLKVGDRVVKLERVSGKRDGDRIELTFVGDGGEASARVRRDGVIESLRIDGKPVELAQQATMQNLLIAGDEMRGRITCIMPSVQLRVLFRSSF